MATSFLGLAVGLVVATAAVSYGCASGPRSVGSTSLTAATAAQLDRAPTSDATARDDLAKKAPAVAAASNVDTVAPSREAEADDPQPTIAAVLVVRGDVASKCLGAGERSDWRVALEHVTTCMKTGALRHQNLFVKGDEKTRAATRCVLAKMGIAESRVELRAAGGSPTSTVELGLASRAAPGSAGSLTLPIDSGTVVAFLSDDNLD